jgi:hypothetical protein
VGAPNPYILDGYGGGAIAITAEVVLDPGDSIDLPLDALRNTFGEVVLLDTLRWTADAQQSVESSDPPTSAVGFVGSAVGISMRIGDRPMTAGEIPLFTLGRPAGLDVESMVLGVADDGGTEFLLGGYCSGVWAFDEALQLDANESISLHLTNKGLLNLPVAVSIAFTGRVGNDLPRSRWVPYTAVWVSPSLDPNVPTANVPTIVTSTERDLINRAPGTLQISSFIGRIVRLGVVGTTLTLNAESTFPSIEEIIGGLPNTNWFPGAVDSAILVSMRDSRGNDNVPLDTPFRQVFEPESRSWVCPHELEPNGYYLVQLTLTPPVVKDTSIQPIVSMTGAWRYDGM